MGMELDLDLIIPETPTREPQDRIVLFLRDYLTDYNAENRKGTENWIYPDFPMLAKMKDKNNYPRVSVIEIGESGTIAGCGSNDMINTATFEIAVYVKERLRCKVGLREMGDQELCNKIARDIIYALRTYWRDDENLSPFHHFGVIGNYTLPFDEDVRIFTRKIEIETILFNAGEE
ncbi:MAG: hypothetical protein ACTSPB_02045 [Candidatus Thorarchaeota archaeon]